MNRIKRLRTLNGITQVALCKALNITQSSLSGYENGKFEAPLDTYIAIAEYFHVSVDYLLGREDIKNPAPLHDSWERDDLSDIDRELICLLSRLNPEDARLARAYIQALVDKQGADASDDH